MADIPLVSPVGRMSSLPKLSSHPRFSADASAAYASAALKLLLPLAITPLLARRLEPTAFGSLAVLLSLGLSGSVFIELGFGLSAAREASGADARTQSGIAAQVLGTRLVCAAVLLVMTLFVSFFWISAYATTAACLATGALAFSIGGSHAWYFQANGRFRTWSMLEIASTLVGFCLFVAFARDTASSMWCYAAFYGLSTWGSIVWLQMDVGHGRLTLARLKAGFRMTVGMATFRMVTATYSSAVPALLSLVMPLPAVAAFHVCDRLVRAVSAGFQPFTQILFPKACLLASQDIPTFEAMTRSWLWRLGVAGATAAAALSAFSAPLATLVAGPHLREASRAVLIVFPWLLLPLAVSSVLGLLWLVPRRMERPFNLCIGIGGICGIALLLLLPRTFGAVGAAWALLVSETCVTLAMFFIYARARKE